MSAQYITPNKVKKHFETTKSGSKYHSKAALEGMRKQEIVGTPPKSGKKRIWLTGTPIRVAKGPPKCVRRSPRKRFQVLSDTSKVVPRGVLEAET